MEDSRIGGRLFWKLLLALCLSMLLSLLGAGLYLRLTAGLPPPPPPGVGSLGPFPLAPLVSGLVTILVTGTVLAWYLAGPLRHLRWALRRVTQGHLETRVQPLMRGRRDEITDLAEDFDRMAARLQALTESRRQLLHDISHELRSPLSRMQAAIGLLRQEPASTPEMLERIELETRRLDALIEELLTLHRLEAAPAAVTRERVDVIELLHAIAEDADFEARSAGRRVEIRAEGEFVAGVNGDLLYRAFENVIRNAVKFTAPGTTAEVHAAIDEGGALVTTVRDRGPGVPEAALQAIFEPFTRLEGSEGVRGVGLGLAIARRALALHGGGIHARAREGGGLEMVVRVPAQ